MDQDEIDFKFLIRVLNSCKTIEHLNVTDKLFNNFIKKWEFKIHYHELFLYKNEYKNIYNIINQKN